MARRPGQLMPQNHPLNYAKSQYLFNPQSIQVVVEAALERIFSQVLRLGFDRSCTQIFQALYDDSVKASPHYNSEYVRENSIDADESCIFLERNGAVVRSSSKTLIVSPSVTLITLP